LGEIGFKKHNIDKSYLYGPTFVLLSPAEMRYKIDDCDMIFSTKNSVYPNQGVTGEVTVTVTPCPNKACRCSDRFDFLF